MGVKMDTAKLIQTDSGQTLFLPDAYCFPGTEVALRRVGNTVVLFPVEDSPLDQTLFSLPAAQWETLAQALDAPVQANSALQRTLSAPAPWEKTA